MIEIVREEKDGLSKQVWLFRASMPHPYATGKVTVTFERYDVCTRATRRHKYFTTRSYMHKSRNIDRFPGQTIIRDFSEVPMPEDVKQEALASVVIELILQPKEG